MNDTSTLEHRAAVHSRSIATVIDRWLPASDGDPLRSAMRYSALAPGKRVRGILALLVVDDAGVPSATACKLAAAIELVHAASLILDDLPCMDDASLRRGRACAHLVFGEPTAILAAVALMNGGYGLAASSEHVAPDVRLACVQVLFQSIGAAGLTAGQHDDLSATARTLSDITNVHARKTGALFAAALTIGALAAGVESDKLHHYDKAGAAIGLAFQAYDDILDLNPTTVETGKDVNRDHGKPTIVHFLGRDGAERWAEEQLATAIRHLGEAGSAQGSSVTAYVDHLAAMLRDRLVKP